MKINLSLRPRVPLTIACFLLILLSACGGDDDTPSLAVRSDISAANTSQPGATPFISLVSLKGHFLPSVAAVNYSIQPKPGTVSQSVGVSYTADALSRRGYLQAGAGTLALPVFGLYAGYQNAVLLNLVFIDGSVQTIPLSITTAAYADPTGIYDRPVILHPRAPGTSLGFDFFAIKSILGPPIILDTDGQIRWAGVSNGDPSASAIFENGGFTVGSNVTTKVTRYELDGSVSTAATPNISFTSFTHNIDPGKTCDLVEIDTTISLGATIAESCADGSVVNVWDLAALISAYMTSHGDDPSRFVINGADWFHINAATYDPRDDSVIVSSRENFLIKLDWKTGAIIWILGDPAKYWYTFPSLRAKALTLQAGGLYPIGQHAVSITPDGKVMIFNDGTPSISQPSGAPVGASQTYSAVSAYSIDASKMTAVNVWNFDYGQSIFSAFCSSAYSAPDGSLLVDYALADSNTHARLVGLDSKQSVIFDIQLDNNPTSCNTAWNSIPIPLHSLQFR